MPPLIIRFKLERVTLQLTIRQQMSTLTVIFWILAESRMSLLVKSSLDS